MKWDHDPEAGNPPDDGAESVSKERGITRRDLVKLTVAAAIVAPLVDLPAARAALVQAAAAPRFFTPAELALVDELAEMIIPADDHSPGARAAGVAAYIDARLAESWDGDDKESWRSGLKAVDALSRATNGKAFLEAAPDARVALLTTISKNEFDPKTPEEKFFRQLKGTTAYVYYTSEIGIHKEIGYLGNSYQEVYAGYDVSQEDAAPAAASGSGGDT